MQTFEWDAKLKKKGRYFLNFGCLRKLLSEGVVLEIVVVVMYELFTDDLKSKITVMNYLMVYRYLQVIYECSFFFPTNRIVYARILLLSISKLVFKPTLSDKLAGQLRKGGRSVESGTNWDVSSPLVSGPQRTILFSYFLSFF